jgi:fructokinase
VQHVGADLAQQIAGFLHTHAHLLDELEGQADLVHADFNPHNILVEQHDDKWKVTAVLDWEFAFAGPPLFDIGNMLRNDHRMPPVFVSQFIAGFTEAGSQLPHNWRKQIKLLDLLNLCDLLPHTKPGDATSSDLVELIQRTVSWNEA